MRVTGSRVYSRPVPVPKMPPGLVELMEGLTKDVLKNNPPDIYEFCAGHTWKLLEIRDGPSTKKKISLEEKISKAQRKVKKRADERWLKIEEKPQAKVISETGDCKGSLQVEGKVQTQAADENITPIVIKPVHNEKDLMQTSEIEISCESDNTATLALNEKTDGHVKILLEGATMPLHEEYTSQEVLNIISGEHVEEEQYPQEVYDEQKEQKHVEQRVQDESKVQDKPKVHEQKDQDEQKVIDIDNDKKNDCDLKFPDEQKISNEQKLNEQKVTDEQKIPDEQKLNEQKVPDKQKDSDEQKLNKQKVSDEQTIPDAQKLNEQKVPDEQIISDEHKVPNNHKISDEHKLYVQEVPNEHKIPDEQKLNEQRVPDEQKVQKVPDEQKIPDEQKLSKQRDADEQKVPDEQKFHDEEIVHDELKLNDELKLHGDKNHNDVQKLADDKNDSADKKLNDEQKLPFEQEICIDQEVHEERKLPVDKKYQVEPNVHHEPGSYDEQVCNKPINDLQTDFEAGKNHQLGCEIKVPENEHKLDDHIRQASEIKDDLDTSDSKQVTGQKKSDILINNTEGSPLSENEVESKENKSLIHNSNDSDPNKPVDTANTPSRVVLEDKEADMKSQHNINSNTEPTNNTNDLETSSDLEKVLNDAIENIKRKDSSADSLKDPNVINEEESDASDSSNVGDNNIAVFKSKVDDKETSETITSDINLTPSDAVSEEEPKERSKRNVQENFVDEVHSNNALHQDRQVIDEPDNSVNVIASPNSDENTQNLVSQPHTMDLETAAVTIQKVFRTFLFKSRASTFDEPVNEESNLSDDDEKKDDRQFLPTNIAKERRPLGISRMDTVLQTVNEEKSLSLSTDDSSLSSAATTIQAHVRGFLVRNKLNSGKTTSSNSVAISNEQSRTSMDGDIDQNKNKTILNIHIVPEGGNYLSRDESMITSMDLSLDGSPPSSVNLHPLGYNTSERRKQLKREDAIQSISPPSNNSGKLSEDVDSIKELQIIEVESHVENQEEKPTMASLLNDDSHPETEVERLKTSPTNSLTNEDNKTSNTEILSGPKPVTESLERSKRNLTKQSSDEMDVVTPFKENISPRDDTQKLLHSGEFHDAALPTKVSRSDTPVVSEFKNVLVYFLFWNN